LKHCLKVRHDERHTVDTALADPFFNVNLDRVNNRRLKQDLRDLEDKIGRKWLTSYGQDFRLSEGDEQEERCADAQSGLLC